MDQSSRMSEAGYFQGAKEHRGSCTFQGTWLSGVKLRFSCQLRAGKELWCLACGAHQHLYIPFPLVAWGKSLSSTAHLAYIGTTLVGHISYLNMGGFRKLRFEMQLERQVNRWIYGSLGKLVDRSRVLHQLGKMHFRQNESKT